MIKKNIILLFLLFSFNIFANISVIEDFSSETKLLNTTNHVLYKNNKEQIREENYFFKNSKNNFKEDIKNIKKKDTNKSNIKSYQKIQKENINSHKKVVKNKKKKSYSKKNIQKKRKVAILVIIIDDIKSKKELNFLHSLPFKVTPSIFPPNNMNMYTPRLAKNLKHYMIHLPLQSNSKIMNKMYKTLFVYDNNKKIESRIKRLRKLFPNAKYINNHTGSIFTANYKKSKVLIKAIKKEGFTFIDSRTTKYSKIKQIDKELNLRYIKNDFFIDNKLDANYTLKKLKKAISLAKKRGYAIVIGHPHPTTFKALKRLNLYLKNIKTVYIDEF